jgi:transglutaminase-like putative cysteine protease
MSLLRIDLTKPRRIFTKTAPDVIAPKPPPPAQAEPSLEERIYSNLLEAYPILSDYVDVLGLVSEATGEPIQRVEHTDKIDQPRLQALARKLFKPQTNYTEEQVKRALIDATGVEPWRADKGLYLLLRAEAIEQTPAGTFYLAGSTPF